MNQTSGAGKTELGDAAKPARPEPGASDTLVRWGNLVVWTLVAVLATLLGIILIPLHASGGFLIPIAPVLGLAANFLIPKPMLTGTGWTGTRFIPAVIWAILALVGSTPTSEGDVLISGNSYSSAVAMAYLGFGALGAVLGIIFASSPMRRPQGRS